jgi:hypothetical protein
MYRCAATIAALVLSATTLQAQATYYVSPAGDDDNAGTIAAPFQTIQRGVDALQTPGDVLEIRGGEYRGVVTIAQKHGTAARPIVIRSYRGERARIDGYLSLTAPAGPRNAWEPASLSDAGAHPDEFVSTRTFSEVSVNRGAFLGAKSHTRLITYSRLEDLRAENETSERITAPVDPRPGPTVVVACAASDTSPACQPIPDCTPDPACAPAPPNRYKPATYRLPWVYMGPGLWFDEATRKVHVRLSPTHNAIEGLSDYAGETDPESARLAVAGRHLVTLRVEQSSHVILSNLDVRFGGDQTIWLKSLQDVTFDRVHIWAGSRGVRMESSTRTAFRNCLFDGGVPGWLFRSDIKDAYSFLLAGRVEWNGVASQTTDTLMSGTATNTATLIEYSEFVNGHDLYLSGSGVRFHHNWVRNLNDDCLFLDAPGYGVSDARIYQNVISQCLAAFSMAGEDVGGPKYIYRNVIDLRVPTAGFRPRNAIDRNVWRYGHPFKFRAPDGPFDLFHNTFIVSPQHASDEFLQASLLHYRDTPVGAPHRRSFNNIFVVNAFIASDVAVTFLPNPSFQGQTDGNNYFRWGSFAAAPFRIAGYCFPAQVPCPPGQSRPATQFANLFTLRQSQYFTDSQGVYAPGFEANSLEVDPLFESIAPTGTVGAGDDFRLSIASPLRNAGITLPAELAALDVTVNPKRNRDIGCCAYRSAPLSVGIDGGRMFP